MKNKLHTLLACILITQISFGSSYAAPKDEKKDKPDTAYNVTIPRFEDHHLKNADWYFDRGLYRQAYNEYYVSIRLNPTFWKGYRGIGNVFMQEGNIKLALEYYLKAINVINPVYAARTLRSAKTDINTGDVMLGIRKLQKILRIDPKAGNLTDEGIKLLVEGKNKDAQKKFEEAIVVDPQYALPYYKLGNMLYETKKYPDAMGYYEKAVKYEKSEFAYFYALANASYKVAFKNKKQVDTALLKRAISNYRVALVLYPRDYDAMFNLATAIIDDVARSAIVVNEAEKTTTHNREAMMNSKNLKEAVNLLERYVENKPMDVNGRLYLGKAYTLWAKKPFQFLTAVDEYKKAMVLDPNLTNLHYDIGITYYVASTIYPASEDLPITPETSKFYVRFGKKYYRGDMLAEAKASFNRYLMSNLRGKERKTSQNYLELIEKQMSTLGFRPPDKEKGY